MNNRSKLIDVFLISSIAIQLTFYCIAWLSLIKQAKLREMDFIGFYTAGKLARSGEYDQIYEINAQREVQSGIVPANTFAGDVNLFQHPPYLVPLFSLIAGNNYTDAFIYWTIILVIILMVCCYLIFKFLIKSGWDRFLALMCAINGICFYPIFLSILKGQDTAFILLGLLIWMFALIQGNNLRSGIGLALATLAPQIAGALALPFIISKRRAAIWFLLACLFLAIYILFLLGPKGVPSFINALILSSQGQSYGINQSAMFNLYGLLLRGFPSIDKNIIQIFIWIVTVLSISFICWLWWVKQKELNVEHIGIAVTIIIFTTPHLHSHSLSLLLLPLLGLSILLRNQESHTARTVAIIIIPLSSLTMLISSMLGDAWMYAISYLLMSILTAGSAFYLINHSKRVIPGVSRSS